MTNDSPQQEKKESNEFIKFTMFTNLPNNHGKKSKLSWGIRDNNPSISVFTNDPNEKTGGNGRYEIPMNAAMNPETFLAFLDVFQKIINGENNVKNKIECWTSYGSNEDKDKTLASELWFGKDDQGICWISVLVANKPKIRFNFTLSDYHRIFKQDGNPFNENEASVLQANAVINAIRAIYYSKLNVYKPKDKFINNDRNTTKQVSTASDTFDEDIPF